MHHLDRNAHSEWASTASRRPVVRMAPSRRKPLYVGDLVSGWGAVVLSVILAIIIF